MQVAQFGEPLSFTSSVGVGQLDQGNRLAQRDLGRRPSQAGARLQNGQLVGFLGEADGLDGPQALGENGGAEIEQIDDRLHRAPEVRIMLDRRQLGRHQAEGLAGGVQQRLAIVDADRSLRAFGILVARQFDGNLGAVRRRKQKGPSCRQAVKISRMASSPWPTSDVTILRFSSASLLRIARTMVSRAVSGAAIARPAARRPTTAPRVHSSGRRNDFQTMRF
jgi:hypothetical protein